MPDDLGVTMERIQRLSDIAKALRGAREAISPKKCRFCGDPRDDLDEFGYCGPCNRGMERTNGD